MYSFNFPNMINSATTELVSDNDAIIVNIKLLLNAVKKSLFGDPYFGSNLKKYIFAQSNIAMRDMIVDEIYTSIIQYIPEVKISRKDIKIQLKPFSPYVNDQHTVMAAEKAKVYVQIHCISNIDNTPIALNLVLTGN